MVEQIGGRRPGGGLGRFGEVVDPVGEVVACREAEHGGVGDRHNPRFGEMWAHVSKSQGRQFEPTATLSTRGAREVPGARPERPLMTTTPAVGRQTSHAVELSVDASCQTLGLPSVRANHARMTQESAKAPHDQALAATAIALPWPDR